LSGSKVLDEEQLRTVADMLLGAERLLMSVPADQAAQELGWKILNAIPHTVMTVDPGFGIGDAGASLTLDGQDWVTGILVDVCEATVDAGPEVTALREDVFASAAQVLTRVFGPPTTRRPGADPEVWWRREMLTLKLRIGWLAVDLELTRNQDADEPEEYQ
jgi:hypothetical protein